MSPTVLVDLARELRVDATAGFVRAFVDLWPQFSWQTLMPKTSGLVGPPFVERNIHPR